MPHSNHTPDTSDSTEFSNSNREDTGSVSRKATSKKKTGSKKAAAKKVAKKKVATKKKVAKKAVTEKAAAKKAATKKTPTKKTPTKKTAAKKTAAKKTAKKAATKKVTKKAAAKKTTTKKAVTKKTASKKLTPKTEASKETVETKTTPAAPDPDKKKEKDVSSEGRKRKRSSSSKKDGGKKGSKKGKKNSTSEEGSKKDSSSSNKKSKKSSDRGRQRRGARRHGDALPEAESGPTPENRVMLVNEIPGEECRIALLENGRIDEYFVERASSATVVGNIYKARVTNIEPAIQAAFVDFGLGESGFLHVSDLHPKYFPGSEMVEQVGKKIPRKQRPPIQDALKKGQEILVQVLKQGIGTKGPTVTSYLSIPGRLMVMMPDMDRIGVSRKVADDEQRKKMRGILDSLDLPEKFGFIVRTAGFESSKLELRRDVAYLKRLWDQMDRRIQNTGAPCLLYAESDLLIRTIRDVLDSSIKTIVSDHPAAFERATNFLKVSGVTSGPEIRYYDRSMPLFSAFGVEKQIANLHLKEVPLNSGGALVIEQTEALVAIDVNSGRSRSAKDSETNAYETNKEAVDEICRQLRLRDLGGLIVNDLIDMRHQKHREEIERRIMRNLKRDRAKSTVLPISDFGIVEMTRQRMRPNTKKANFELCPTCEGTGEAPRPDSVAADALRRAAVVLEDESVRRIELVCSKAISTILSVEKKKEIERFEERSKRKIDIQISDKIAEKRVDIYAYDETGADVEVSKSLNHKVPKISDLPLEVDPDDARSARKSGKRRRRRGRGKTAPADATAIALAGGFEIDEELDELDNAQEESDSRESEGKDGKDGEQAEGTKKKRKRRRRGRGKGRAAREARQREEDSKSIRVYALAKELETTSKEILERCREEGGFDELKNHMSSLEGEPLLKVRGWFAPEPKPAEEEASGTSDSPLEDGESDEKPKRKRRRRRGRRGRRKDADEESSASEDPSEKKEDESSSEQTSEGRADSTERHSDDSNSDEDDDRPRKRRRRRRGRRRRKAESEQDGDDGANNEKQSGEDSNSKSDEDGQRGGKRHKKRSRRDRETKSETGSPTKDPSNQPSPAPTPPSTSAQSEDPPKAAPKRRSLYGGRIRRVSGMNLNPGK